MARFVLGKCRIKVDFFMVVPSPSRATDSDRTRDMSPFAGRLSKFAYQVDVILKKDIFRAYRDHKRYTF